MRKEWILNLQIFGEGGGAAGDGGAGLSAEGNQGGNIQVLEDGTQVDHRLAERMEKLRKRHPGKFSGGTAAAANGNGQGQGNGNQGDGLMNGQNGTQPGNVRNAQDQGQTAKTPEQEFDELIRGKYRNQYQARFQQGISERFKNQADLQGQLDGLKPMLDALAKQRGIEPGNYDALSKNILDDDSLYEEEAEAAGMTVEAFKNFQKLKNEAEAARQREAQTEERRQFSNHLQNLARQGEELKNIFPDFDLMTELNNPAFRRMTSPEVNLTVEQAYYAVHHNEIMPQIMSAGIQRAQRQIGQSLQANAARPVEGALSGNGQAAELHRNPRDMSRAERAAIRERVRRGERITL